LAVLDHDQRGDHPATGPGVHLGLGATRYRVAASLSWGAASRVIYALSGGPFLSGLRSQQPPLCWWLGAGAQGRFASLLAPMSRSVRVKALTDRMVRFRQTARLRPGDASAKLSGGGRLGFFLGCSP